MEQYQPLVEDSQEQIPIDPWQQAFEALDKETQSNSEDNASGGADVPDGSDSSSEADNSGENSNEDETEDSTVPSVEVGGSDSLGGAPSDSNAEGDQVFQALSEDDITSYKNSINEEVKQRAIKDVAQAYIQKGARNHNGQLGATINDPDICRRDDDGVPHYYNPETGREYDGPNPRHDAQQWVNDYNTELAENFNKTCDAYVNKLMEDYKPRIAVLEFAPKYDKLDDVRRSMLDSILEDYEIKDNKGEIIGYSCDLNKALDAVNRQVRVIQERFNTQGAQAEDKPKGPALDMKNSANVAANKGEKPKFKSIEEAMEWEQDQLLEKMKGKK